MVKFIMLVGLFAYIALVAVETAAELQVAPAIKVSNSIHSMFGAK